MLAIVQEVTLGKPVQEACDIYGVPKSTYYKWLYKEQDTVEDFRAFVSETQRGSLASILSVQERVLSLVISDALAIGTDPQTRVLIAKYLADTADKLAEKHRAVGSDSARKFLTGPVQRIVESKLGSQANITGGELLIKFDITQSEDDEEEPVEGEFTPATPLLLEE